MLVFLVSAIVLCNKTIAEPLSDQDIIQNDGLISEELFTLFFNVNKTHTKEALNEYISEIEDFTQKLAKKQHRYHSDKQFLKYAFYKIHNRYMKRYSEHTDLLDLLDEGEYDCITGTALYALILDALDIRYTIKELPFHVYLMVQPEDQEGVVLLESTDAIGGFVEDPQEIEDRVAMYSGKEASDKPDQYKYDFEINSEIDLKKLAALSYYNEAVAYYNQQNLQQAAHYLNYATQLYPAKRMEALCTLIKQVGGEPVTQAGR